MDIRPAGLGSSPYTVLVLLVGVALVMASTGLQGSLIGVRGAIEGFSTVSLGAIIATYYVGFVVGSTRAPALIAKVGHIRVFAALASTVSAIIVLHAVFVSPLAWLVLRPLVGFCMAGFYVVVESWLNDLSDNASRGRVFALYMIVLVGAVASGQILLNVADPAGFQLFVLAAVLVSFAVVPMALTVTVAPAIALIHPMRLRDVVAVAPLGIVGATVAGVAYSSLIGMGAVFGNAAGLSVPRISVLIAVTVLGGMVGQWPISRASDRRDRRIVIAITSLLAAVAAGVTVLLVDSTWPLLVGFGVLGMLSMPLYSLAVSHLNDWLEPEQIVTASATLVLTAGIGSIAGPLLSSVMLTVAGPAGFLWLMAAVHVVLGVYGLHRLGVRPMSPRQRPSRYVAFVTRAGTVAANLGRSRVPESGPAPSGPPST
jgi:MFS family permease